jgi:2',3'-cyclic-nucleotide 2'-phosphodiesterase (5'-nucleotidase family)
MRYQFAILAACILLAGCSKSDRNALRLIYSGSLDGYLEPCGCKEGKVGGLARLAGAAHDSLKKWKNSALLLDAGDFGETYILPGDPKNRYLLQAYQAMHYDAINVTAQDLIAGLETLKWAADSLGLPLISANLIQGDSTRHPFPGWVIRKAWNKRVGIIGIGSIRPLELRLSGNAELSFTDPETAIRRALEQVRPQCDMVILLCDLNSRSTREMAVKIAGIDLIISTMEVTPTSIVRKFGGAYVAGTSRKGKALTILTLRQAADSLACGFTRTLLDSTFRSEAAVERIVAEYKKTRPQNEPKNVYYGGEE